MTVGDLGTRLLIDITQEPMSRSLHMHYILESTFARIFLFLERQELFGTARTV